jgi:hypothetical protein
MPIVLQTVIAGTAMLKRATGKNVMTAMQFLKMDVLQFAWMKVAETAFCREV